MTVETWLPLVLGYLIPVGLFLLGWGGLPPEHARRAATLGLVALALATVAYFAVGFAFHLGGAAVVADLPGLEGLDALVGYRAGAGLYWGVLGLDGFLLLGDAATPEATVLFATYLPMVAAAVLLPALSLGSRARGWQVGLLSLWTGAVLLPLAACWVWGGGWLAALGRTMGRGHGVVDYGGSGVVYLLGGMTALGGLLALGRVPPSEGPEEMPPAHFPLLANLGALLVLMGWLGWCLGTPFHVAGSRIDAGRIAVNGLLATAGSTLTALFYCWLAQGRGNPLMVARGAVTGLVAISAGAPFLPPWAALAVGAVAGLLLPLSLFAVDHLLRLADRSAAVAVGGLSGLWGLLSVALFADGASGQGWNGIGPETYRMVAGQGVTGFLPAPGMVGDGPGQLIAQVAGAAAVTALGLLGGWAVMKLLAAIGSSAARNGERTSDSSEGDRAD